MTVAAAVGSALTGFGQRLRDHGLALTPEQLVRFHTALAVLDAGDLHDLYWAGRACLTSEADDRETYDGVFAEVFLGLAPVSPVQAEATGDRRGHEASTGGSRRDGAHDDGPGQPSEGEAGAVASSVELLRHKAFPACTPEEAAVIARLLRTLRPQIPLRRSRRTVRDRSRGRLDLRATVRRSLRTHGEPVHRHWRRRTQRPRKLLLLLDVSGSMSGYSRPLLQFGHALAAAGAPLEAYCFGTRLTRVTGSMAAADPDAALARAAAAVLDWDGGTRIGEAVRDLLADRQAQGFLSGAVAIVCSDGLERGDPALLGLQMARLTRIAFRVVWVNPLKGEPGFEPATRGMRAALPHVDHLVAGDTLASLERLGELLQTLAAPLQHVKVD